MRRNCGALDEKSGATFASVGANFQVLTERPRTTGRVVGDANFALLSRRDRSSGELSRSASTRYCDIENEKRFVTGVGDFERSRNRSVILLDDAEIESFLGESCLSIFIVVGLSKRESKESKDKGSDKIFHKKKSECDN